MSEPFQSTNKLFDNTNPDLGGVIARGTFTVSGFTAQATGYVASASVELKELNTEVYPHAIDVYHQVDYGGGVTGWRKCSYDTITTGGAVKVSVNVEILSTVVGGSPNPSIFTLQTTYYSLNNSSGQRDSAFYSQVFYYIVRTTAVFDE